MVMEYSIIIIIIGLEGLQRRLCSWTLSTEFKITNYKLVSG